jgi:hypothetical protein
MLSLMKNKLYTLPYTGVFNTRCIFLHNTMYTHIHACLIFTQKLPFVPEEKNYLYIFFLHTASHKFLFWHTCCQCPSKMKTHLNKETNSLIWLNLTLTWVISRDWMFWFPQNTFLSTRQTKQGNDHIYIHTHTHTKHITKEVTVNFEPWVCVVMFLLK